LGFKISVSLGNGGLCRKGYKMQCLHLIPCEVDYVMIEVYEGVCGNHLGARSLVYKLICAGYYFGPPCRRTPSST